MNGAPPPTRRVGVAIAACALLLATLLGIARPVRAADVASEVSVKAALLYNFAKFTEWPGGLPSDSPLVFCIVGNDAIEAELRGMVRAQAIAGHALDVRRPDEPASWKACHILFLAEADAARSTAALAALRTLPVLTVSDGKDFAVAGGIIELYIEKASMRFAINVTAAEQAGLHISSRVLVLAKIRGNSHVQ